VWNWTRAAEFQWDPRAREPGSTTEESDSKGPVYTRQKRLITSQQPATFTQPKAFENEPAASDFYATKPFEKEPAASNFHATKTV
jgi:hypothetical protein